MESFTCTTNYDISKAESTDNTIKNYYGSQSFLIGAEGLNGSTWAEINTSDFVGDSGQPWSVINDKSLDNPYKTTEDGE